LAIPIQALTTRTKGDLEPKKKSGAAVAKLTPSEEKALKEELQGVFVVTGGKAEFKKVDTGITGAQDIQVLTGLSDGDEIVTGPFQVVRTLRNAAGVKVDNKPPVVKPAS
jgi:HlyD family secretion protein